MGTHHRSAQNFVPVLRYRWFLMAMVVYLGSLALFGVVHYRETQSRILSQLDQKLLAGALSLDHLLGPEFHDRFQQPDQMTAAEELAWVMKATSLNKDLGLEYIYAMVERDGQIFFTAASANEEELQQGTHQAFYRLYDDAGPVIYDAFQSEETRYVEIIDQWGHFRTVLVPRRTPQGRTYLLAADIAVHDLSVALQSSLRETLLIAMILIVFTLPLLLLYAYPLKQQLYVHPITGLPNRNCLERDLLRFETPQLTLINIDGFHQINDFFGANYGNQFLNHVAQQIKQMMTRTDRLYKLGADEYVILREDSADGIPIESIVQTLNQQQIEMAGSRVPLAVTAGVSIGRIHALEHADLALKQARKQNREIVRYTDSMHSTKDFQSNLEWTGILKEAIDDNRIIAWFQPIHDNLWNEIAHYEALVRLVDRSGRTIGPAQFLEVARSSRLLGRLSLIMLDQALEEAEKTGHSYSVNLTVDNLTNPDSASAILKRLEESPAANRIIFEIVESEGIEHLAKVLDFIQRVKTLGASIAIDDFGTGYSNFKHLLELPVDYIKIDGSLIQQITHSAAARAVVAAIVTFANQLDAKVVAEYVSDSTVQEAVILLKIHFSQGYFFGPPAPADEVPDENAVVLPSPNELSEHLKLI